VSRLLYVTTSTTLGGAEKTVYTLATLVDPKICEVVGVTSIKPKGYYAHKLEKAGVPVYSLNVGERAGLGDLQKLAVVIYETKPDIVHAVMYQAMQLCRAVRRLGYADFKLVSSPRVNYRTRTGFSLLIDRVLKSADDLLIAECEASRQYLIDRQGYDSEKTVTIYNGVDIAGWSISKTVRAERRKQLRLDDKEILIGSVGRLDQQKGYSYLLEAIAKLRAVHPVKCVIVGQGPMAKQLQGQIRQLHIEDSVYLAGEQPQGDISSWLSAMDIFVLPSLWEGLPNALLEAMALGLPVVATRVDGVPEAISHDVSGNLVTPKDSHALSVQIGDIIVDAALRQRLGENGKKVIEENFRLVDMIQKYEAAYRRVLGPEQPA